MKCPQCGADSRTTPKCDQCGYPLSGTGAEKAAFIARRILNSSHVEDAHKSIRTARIILFALGGANILLALVFASSGIGMAMSLLIGTGFVMFGIVLPRKPLLFLMIALALLLMLYLSDAIVDPGSLFRGLIWKVGCVSALIIAINRVRRAERIRQESP